MGLQSRMSSGVACLAWGAEEHGGGGKHHSLVLPVAFRGMCKATQGSQYQSRGPLHTHQLHGLQTLIGPLTQTPTRLSDIPIGTYTTELPQSVKAPIPLRLQVQILHRTYLY